MTEPFWNKKIDRRDFFKASAMGAAAALTVPSLLGKPAVASAETREFALKPISWTECQKLSPADMLGASQMTNPGYDYLMKLAEGLKDSKVREIAIKGLKSPEPKILELFPDKASKEKVRTKLLDAGYIKSDTTADQIFPPDKGAHTKIQDFRLSPGSGWASHHAYPGGLVAHVATDMQAALGILDNFEQMFGYSMNRDLVTSAVLLHDDQKPWIFQWRKDNSCLPEARIAGQGDHHIMEIADVIHRGLDPDLVISIADSHVHPGNAKDEKSLIGCIKAAAIIAGEDPVHYGLLPADGSTLPLPRRPEGFIVHLGDHDFILASAVPKWVAKKLQSMTKSVYHFSDADLKGKPFNTLRNYVFSQMSDLHLYQIWIDQGEKAMLKAVTDLVIPE